MLGARLDDDTVRLAAPHERVAISGAHGEGHELEPTGRWLRLTGGRLLEHQHGAVEPEPNPVECAVADDPPNLSEPENLPVETCQRDDIAGAKGDVVHAHGSPKLAPRIVIASGAAHLIDSWPMKLPPFRELRDRISELPNRVRVVGRVANQSGILWELTFPGVRAFAKAFLGSTTPSHIYRVHAANAPNKPALRWHDRVLTFGELDARINGVARGLAERGLRRGTSLVLMMRNRPEFVELQAGAARIGVAAVSVSWRSTPSELVYLATHCGARALCFEADLWPVVERARAELKDIPSDRVFAIGGDAPGCTPYESLVVRNAGNATDSDAERDAAVVIYTSGTTGKPKGAVRKFPRDTLPAALKFIGETPMRADDVHLVTCPLYHSTAFGFLALSHLLGATAVLMDEFRPREFLEHVERFGITTTAVVPTMLHRVLALGPETRARYHTRSLRVTFCGGAPLPGPVATSWMDAYGDILYNFYGATETGLVTLAKPADLRAAPGCIGRAVPGNEIRLLGEDGNEVLAGAVGELYVRNKLLVHGYHQDDHATRACMRDGFFSVGDLARRDAEGRYFIEGRKRDMIISGGVNVYPAEVEGALEAHPDVAEVAVIGVADPEWGERVRAFVVLRPGATADEGALKAWVRERLAGPKVPRDYVFLEQLPRNPTGKVLKRELRDLMA